MTPFWIPSELANLKQWNRCLSMTFLSEKRTESCQPTNKLIPTALYFIKRLFCANFFCVRPSDLICKGHGNFEAHVIFSCLFHYHRFGAVECWVSHSPGEFLPAPSAPRLGRRRRGGVGGCSGSHSAIRSDGWTSPSKVWSLKTHISKTVSLCFETGRLQAVKHSG